jgi:hypothetical protein
MNARIDINYIYIYKTVSRKRRPEDWTDQPPHHKASDSKKREKIGAISLYGRIITFLILLVHSRPAPFSFLLLLMPRKLPMATARPETS